MRESSAAAAVVVGGAVFSAASGPEPLPDDIVVVAAGVGVAADDKSVVALTDGAPISGLAESPVAGELPVGC